MLEQSESQPGKLFERAPEKRQQEFLTVEFIQLFSEFTKELNKVGVELYRCNNNLNLISQELVKISEAIQDAGKI